MERFTNSILIVFSVLTIGWLISLDPKETQDTKRVCPDLEDEITTLEAKTSIEAAQVMAKKASKHAMREGEAKFLLSCADNILEYPEIGTPQAFILEATHIISKKYGGSYEIAVLQKPIGKRLEDNQDYQAGWELLKHLKGYQEFIKRLHAAKTEDQLKEIRSDWILFKQCRDTLFQSFREQDEVKPAEEPAEEPMRPAPASDTTDGIQVESLVLR